MQTGDGRRAYPALSEEESLEERERERILHALAACNWNRCRAAVMAGIPRRTFYRRLHEYGIFEAPHGAERRA